MAHEKKTFAFIITANAVPYNKDTVEYLFGDGATCDRNYPEWHLALEDIFEMTQDAICLVAMSKMRFLSDNKTDDVSKINDRDSGFWEYLEDKEKKYKAMQKTIKPLDIHSVEQP